MVPLDSHNLGATFTRKRESSCEKAPKEPQFLFRSRQNKKCRSKSVNVVQPTEQPTKKNRKIFGYCCFSPKQKQCHRRVFFYPSIVYDRFSEFKARAIILAPNKSHANERVCLTRNEIRGSQIRNITSPFKTPHQEAPPCP